MEITKDGDRIKIRDFGRGLKYEHLTQKENQEKQIIQSSDLSELINIIRDPEHVTQEIKGFMTAWTGAINFQDEKGGNILSEQALGLEEFIKILFTLFCDVARRSLNIFKRHNTTSYF